MLSKLVSWWSYFYAIPWCVPAWGWSEFRATTGCILTGRVGTGPAARRFADAVGSFLGARYALPVNRGQTAIEIGLRAMGIGPGDDVVLPAFLCRSALDAVTGTGATPVFADVGPDLNVTPATILAALTVRTKCVIVAHLFGAAAPIGEIEELLAKRGIALMDDAAQALGARCAGRLVGTFGACGIVSCGPGKPLAGAAGGLLLTNDQALYERAAALPLQSEGSFDVARRTLSFWLWRRFRRFTLPFKVILDRAFGEAAEPPHMNARLSNLDAAMALAQFNSLAENAARRRQNGALLASRLAHPGYEQLSDFSPASMLAKLVYVVPEEGPPLTAIIRTLAAAGIECQGGYRPLNEGIGMAADIPLTEALWQRVLCVPVETRPRIA